MPSIDAAPVTMDLSAATDWVRAHEEEDDLVADPEIYAALASIESGIAEAAFVELGNLIAAQRALQGGG